MAGEINNNSKVDITSLQKLMAEKEVNKSEVGSDTKLNSIFEEYDTSPKDGKISGGELTGFRAAIKLIIATFTKTERTDKSEKATTADVKEATNEPVKEQEPKFVDDKGNIESEVKTDKNGSSYKTHDGESVTSTKNSITVTGKTGEKEGLQKTSDGGYILIGDGQKTYFDKNMKIIKQEPVG